jgi:ketosteroid isomerase-like protein
MKLRNVLVLAALTMSMGFAASAADSKCPMSTNWQDTYNKGSVDGVAAMYAENAVEVTPGGIVDGQAAIKTRIDNLKNKDKLSDVVINTDKCAAGENFRWSAGDWKGTSPQGPMSGYWMSSEMKMNDSWKIITLAFNITPPPAK